MENDPLTEKIIGAAIEVHRYLGPGFRADVIVEDAVLLELKAVEKILPVHEAQMLTYLKLSGIRTGLLMNFNAMPLKNGIKRFVV